MPPNERSEKQAAAQQAVDILYEIATILNCHLDRRTLSICISMIENGVNPEALAVGRAYSSVVWVIMKPPQIIFNSVVVFSTIPLAHSCSFTPLA
ncbi:hypothetical protein N656DRAFT_712442 [Canariomyces notabilis]|uniref:Mitotic-spindle organizing protein 1 n=1 Tax=Canariomyces notabilis TaxID=2074819 RepID=A0AAN6TB98_9PEZI|nr:hypothetical protein N656DRAFT_712442 [Canariomyces arenarius]